ncbi:MAG TPA: SIR2 family protein [Aromatoleum sp.]|uniref:SIR2 family protein n=1 Tax=Aromatoleum sp. TaxID=2307007 RepID=UPI002B46B108|nr:SIR2 family protein [Aromatoleum sp.]HJV28280.1 SIR2 family protein [Aromatoleum sp.]
MNAPNNLMLSLEGTLRGLSNGSLIPYLGAEAVLLDAANAALPVGHPELIARLHRKVPIPARLRTNLTAAAQYIETFRHRKMLRSIMNECFAQPAIPSLLHRWLAGLRPALIVDLGYDGATGTALSEGRSWGQVQGVSRAESRAGQGIEWVRYYDAAGTLCDDSAAEGWNTLLYKPLGSVAPAGNFLVSDADFVEVLTEIDLQTPIPPEVQRRRATRGFVFLGCRFDNQLARTYARQLMKRSAGPHFALIEGPLTRNELQFVAEQGITVIPASVRHLLATLCTTIA